MNLKTKTCSWCGRDLNHRDYEKMDYLTPNEKLRILKACSLECKFKITLNLDPDFLSEWEK